MIYLHPQCIKTGVIARDWAVESGLGLAACYYAEHDALAVVSMLLYLLKGGVGAGFDGSEM